MINCPGCTSNIDEKECSVYTDMTNRIIFCPNCGTEIVIGEMPKYDEKEVNDNGKVK